MLVDVWRDNEDNERKLIGFVFFCNGSWEFIGRFKTMDDLYGSEFVVLGTVDEPKPYVIEERIDNYEFRDNSNHKVEFPSERKELVELDG